jgi:glycosyltransferase involved in cell wall biosynthesis
MGDVYVTTSMAEGFNLPVVEAMACGLPVVSTDFGGMTDVVTNDNGWLLTQGKMKEVVWDEMYHGVSWKVPSIKEIRVQLRSIYNKQSQITAKIQNALDTANNFTWTHSARKAKEFLEQL